MTEPYAYADDADTLYIEADTDAAYVHLLTGDGVNIPARDLPEVIEALARAAGVDLASCLIVPDGGDMTVHQDRDDYEVQHLGPWAEEINEDGLGCTVADALRAVLGGSRG